MDIFVLRELRRYMSILWASIDTERRGLCFLKGKSTLKGKLKIIAAKQPVSPLYVNLYSRCSSLLLKYTAS